jgi:hypothetical protein
MSDYSIDGLIRYFEMAYKVMGYTNPEESSYEYHAAKMLKQLREERDEARREVCSMNETGLRMRESDKQREAKRRGWDCFKENGNA